MLLLELHTASFSKEEWVVTIYYTERVMKSAGDREAQHLKPLREPVLPVSPRTANKKA